MSEHTHTYRSSGVAGTQEQPFTYTASPILDASVHKALYIVRQQLASSENTQFDVPDEIEALHDRVSADLRARILLQRHSIDRALHLLAEEQEAWDGETRAAEAIVRELRKMTDRIGRAEKAVNLSVLICTVCSICMFICMIGFVMLYVSLAAPK